MKNQILNSLKSKRVTLVVILMAVCISLPYASFAKVITLDNSCVIDLPNTLIEKPTKSSQTINHIYFGTNQDCIISIKSVNVDDFDHYKVIYMMDTLCFNLKGFKMVEERHEGFWHLAEDYSYKFYENEGDSIKIVTYTFYSFQMPYCICCIYSSSDNKGLDCFEKVVSGIVKLKPEGFLKQIFLCWHHSKFALMSLLLLGVILGQLLGAIFGRNNSWTISIVYTLVLGIVLLFNIWGYWYLIAAILFSSLYLTHMAAKASFDEFRDHMGL